jgi:hypothetical protein
MIALFTKCGRGNRTGLHLPGPGCEGPARLSGDRVARLVRDNQQPRRHHDDRTEHRMIGRGKIPEPISTGIILNVTSQTVQGSALTSSPGVGGSVMSVRSSSGSQRTTSPQKRPSLVAIDRLTGTLEASSFERMSGSITTTSYTLKCRPAQRMF